MNDWFEAERRVERAQQLCESHRFEEALAELDVALTINPNNATWHAQRGFLLEELDEPEEAVTAYERSLELEPDDRDVSLALGMGLLRLNKVARAVETLSELARRHPDFEPAYCNRIHALAELGRHEQAEEMFYLAQELNDRCPHCFFHMGGSLASRGDFERALYCWRRVLELEPSYMGVNRRIAEAYRSQGRLEEARVSLLAELREDPGNTDLLFEMAELAVQAKDLVGAASKFEQILELDPDDVEARFALGKVWLTSGQPARSIPCFEEVARRASETGKIPDLDRRYGEALLLTGRLAEAREKLERAVAAEPDSVELWMALGNCLLGLQQPGKAAGWFRQVLARDAQNPFAHHHLGLALLQDGQTVRGVKHCMESVRLNPAFVPGLFNAAVAQVQLGGWAEARELLSRVLQSDPSHESAARLRRRLPWYRLRRGLRRAKDLIVRVAGYRIG